MLGRTGFVSDDTEQSALVAQSLARAGDDLDTCVAAFRRAMLGWFLRLPWGIGLGTLRACLRIALGMRRSGVASAGNGAAMRAAIIGAFFADDEPRRRQWVDILSRVTHTDDRAVEGARFVAEVAAICVRGGRVRVGLSETIRAGRAVVENEELGRAIDLALSLVVRGVPLADAALLLGNTGYVVHSVALAAFCFARFGDDRIDAIAAAVQAGGDTDSNAAIVGAWIGARRGEEGLPRQLVDAIHDGPFGRTHLRALADDLVSASASGHSARFSWPVALLRNVALFPVALVQAMRAVAGR
jgi:ADP-ribosyl-[dinitrogen reductase] hydrolase